MKVLARAFVLAAASSAVNADDQPSNLRSASSAVASATSSNFITDLIESIGVVAKKKEHTSLMEAFISVPHVAPHSKDGACGESLVADSFMTAYNKAHQNDGRRVDMFVIDREFYEDGDDELSTTTTDGQDPAVSKRKWTNSGTTMFFGNGRRRYKGTLGPDLFLGEEADGEVSRRYKVDPHDALEKLLCSELRASGCPAYAEADGCEVDFYYSSTATTAARQDPSTSLVSVTSPGASTTLSNADGGDGLEWWRRRNKYIGEADAIVEVGHILRRRHRKGMGPDLTVAGTINVDIDALGKSFINAYNDMHGDGPFKVTNIDLKAAYSIPDVTLLGDGDDKDKDKTVSEYSLYQMSVSWSCVGTKAQCATSDAQPGPPPVVGAVMDHLQFSGLHKAFESLLCDNLRHSGAWMYSQAHDCHTSFAMRRRRRKSKDYNPDFVDATVVDQ